MIHSILIVDDTTVLAEAIADLLRMEGFLVTIAGHGAAGLALLEQERFDLILTDLRMPVMDGIEFIKRVRHSEVPAKTPIIAVSAQVTMQIGRKASRQELISSC